MPKGLASYCINHPAIEATARCRQCRKPVCDVCAVPGAQGIFCSGECRDQFAEFLERARKMDEASGWRWWRFARKVRRAIVKLVVFAIMLLFFASVADLVFGIPIPWWSPVLHQFMGR
jgi:hypothetical protein